MGPLVRYVEDRVDASGGSAACWPWLGYVDPEGYGRLSASRRRQCGEQRAHRAVWWLCRGEPPKAASGLVLDHRCRNRACCNPAHLRLLPKPENDDQQWADSAYGPRAGRCRHGHVGEYVQKPSGPWRCNGCHREAARRLRSRRAD